MEKTGTQTNHGKVSFASSHFEDAVVGELLCRDSSSQIKTYMDTKSLQGKNLNLLGQCCDLPAALPREVHDASSSPVFCDHCIYTGESDVLKRAHGLGSCTWYLYGKSHVGMFQAGFPCGWGTRTWDDGVRYEGFWKGHRLNGRGLINFADGSTYHGMLVDSIRNGQGMYCSTSGFSYSGSWQNDKPHGHGESVDDCHGTKYSGNFACGLMHGHGAMMVIESNGTSRKYEGSFVHGKREGCGVEESSNGTSYSGSWQRNVRHGIGTETILGKGVYVGHWADDLQHGVGIFKSSKSNKNHYEGEWQCGLRHGNAIVSWNSGDSFACKFIKGKMVGTGQLYKPSSCVDPLLCATLLVHSDAIRTTSDGARASTRRAGTLQRERPPLFFMLPARKTVIKATKE